MATYNVTTAKHATLTAATVDTVTLGKDYSSVEVYNRDASAVLYFTTDGTTPTVAGDNTYVVGPGSAVTVQADQDTSTRANAVVKAISSGTPAYSVTGIL